MNLAFNLLQKVNFEYWKCYLFNFSFVSWLVSDLTQIFEKVSIRIFCIHFFAFHFVFKRYFTFPLLKFHVSFLWVFLIELFLWFFCFYWLDIVIASTFIFVLLVLNNILSYLLFQFCSSISLLPTFHFTCLCCLIITLFVDIRWRLHWQTRRGK